MPSLAFTSADTAAWVMVAGWQIRLSMPPRLSAMGMERMMQMRQYAVEERNGIFASQYARTIGLEDLLDPDTARSVERKSTGGKVLVDPSRNPSH